MAINAGVGGAVDHIDDFDDDLFSDEDDADSLFGGSENDQEFSLFMEDVSAPEVNKATQVLPDEPMLFLPPPPEPASLPLPTEPQLSLPTPPSREVCAFVAQDVSIIPVNSHSRLASSPDHLLVPQENQAIDHPQVGEAPNHDAQENHGNIHHLAKLPVILRPRPTSEGPPQLNPFNPDYLSILPWVQLSKYRPSIWSFFHKALY